MSAVMRSRPGIICCFLCMYQLHYFVRFLPSLRFAAGGGLFLSPGWEKRVFELLAAFCQGDLIFQGTGGLVLDPSK